MGQHIGKAIGGWRLLGFWLVQRGGDGFQQGLAFRRQLRRPVAQTGHPCGADQFDQ